MIQSVSSPVSSKESMRWFKTEPHLFTNSSSAFLGSCRRPFVITFESPPQSIIWRASRLITCNLELLKINLWPLSRQTSVAQPSDEKHKLSRHFGFPPHQNIFPHYVVYVLDHSVSFSFHHSATPAALLTSSESGIDVRLAVSSAPVSTSCFLVRSNSWHTQEPESLWSLSWCNAH